MQCILWQDCSSMEFNCQERCGAVDIAEVIRVYQGILIFSLASTSPCFWQSVHCLLNVILPLRFKTKPPPPTNSLLKYVLRMCSSFQGYFLSLKLISYNYKYLIFPESSNIGLYQSTAQSGDDYKRGMWTSNNIRFVSSPARMIFYLYSETVPRLWF